MSNFVLSLMNGIKLVEKVVICEDSVVFKFTDYLEREVPLID